MADKKQLTEMLKKRSPLIPQREAVTPVDLYTKPLTGKTTSRQTDKPTNPLVVKTVSSKVEKYTTHLNHKTIKVIKRFALETDHKDYEVMQEAVEEYLKKRGIPIT